MKILLFPALFALALPAVAQPSVEPVPLAATARVESLGATLQNVALLQGGGFAAVWAEESPGRKGSDVRMQWVRPDGTLVFPAPGQVVSGRSAPVLEPGVAADPHAGVFVAYERYQDEARYTRLVVQKLDGEGRPVWPEPGITVVPADIVAESETMFWLLPDAQGGLFTCFNRDRSSEGNATEIACQHFDAEGRRLWPAAGLVAGGVPGWQIEPRVLPDGHGGILVFWSNQREFDRKPTQRILIEGQRFTAEGARLWGPSGLRIYQTRKPAAGAASIPAFEAVPDGAGGAVLTFDDRPAAVIALRIDNQGRSLWGRGVTVAPASGPVLQLQGGLVAGPDGGTFVAVQEIRRQDKSWRTSVHRLDGAGRQLWGAGGVPLLDPTQQEALVFGMHGTSAGDRLWVVTTYMPDGSRPQDAGVRGVVFDLQGHRLNGPTGVALSDETHTNRLPLSVFDPARGIGFAIWERLRTNDVHVVGALWGGVL